MLGTTNTEFSFIEVWFTDQNSEPLEIEDNVNLTLIIEMRYSIQPKFRRYVKRYGLLSRKVGDKYGKKLMDTATKTGIDAARTASKRVVQKMAEVTGDLIGNIIADKITSIGKPKEKEKAKEIEEIYISPEKRQQLIKIVLSII